MVCNLGSLVTSFLAPLSPFLSPTMPVSTHRSNKDVHPGRIILENQYMRCTRQQIEEDIASAKAAAIAAGEDEVARNKSIAKVEDAVERDKEDMCTYAKRPNLCCHVEPTPDRQ